MRPEPEIGKIFLSARSVYQIMQHSSHAALSLEGRWLKAEKIRRLMAFEPANGPVRLLEIGTGSGAIAHYFTKLEQPSFSVWAVDVEDQRRTRTGYAFSVYNGKRLPFGDASFDAVISNHVIEHVGGREQQANHIGEICRVLTPGGSAYLATPSRWQLIEPHFHLPFLSWIPRGWRDSYVRLTGRGDRYDCDLLRPYELRDLLDICGLSYRNLNTRAVRELVALEGNRNFMLQLIAAMPAALLEILSGFSPTLIYLLHKSPSRHTGGGTGT